MMIPHRFNDVGSAEMITIDRTGLDWTGLDTFSGNNINIWPRISQQQMRAHKHPIAPLQKYDETISIR